MKFLEGSSALTLPRGTLSIMPAFDERSALDGLRRLDSYAIGAIYDKYFPEIYRYVRYRVSDDSVAEDIASDVFVRMIESTQRNQGPTTNLRGWLIATTSNAVNDHLRRQYRRPTEELKESMPDDASNIHVQVDQREQARQLRIAFAQLTSEQQHVLTLRFGMGYSLEQTAAIMKKNVNAIKALQFRALTALQRQIGEVTRE
jgi:RNA polymerase sigma-70 factor (ECF subfamily)